MIGDEIYTKLSSIHILDIEEYVAPRLKEITLFEFVVAVMLTQNTNDKNAWRAYSNLKSKIGSLSPDNILITPPEEISSSIKTAGMYIQRTRRIIELAEIFRQRDVDREITGLLEKGLIEDARRILLELPGIGLKTADVVLLMYYGVPVFPVDTHITRITRRLGFVKRRNYMAIRDFWMKNTSPGLYLPLHLLLIRHGRKICRARNPACTICVISEYCSFYKGIS